MTSQEIYSTAMAGKLDNWVPACGGDEQPFTFNGVRWLYVYNPAQHLHGYLNLDTDVVNTDRDFHPALGC